MMLENEEEKSMQNLENDPFETLWQNHIWQKQDDIVYVTQLWKKFWHFHLFILEFPR